MKKQRNETGLEGNKRIILMPDWDNREYEKNIALLETTNKKRLKTTSLHRWHMASGANMADFGGYDMPLWYETGVKNEHLAILESAGIFDTSHMACITCKGKDAFELIQFCFTRDIKSLEIGKCVYGAFLDENGFSIDDAIIYKFSNEIFMICVNSGMGETISNHLIDKKRNGSVEIDFKQSRY